MELQLACFDSKAVVGRTQLLLQPLLTHIDCFVLLQSLLTVLHLDIFALTQHIELQIYNLEKLLQKILF